MKFGENLQSHITSEWRTQYVDYERLKEILYDWKENAPCPDSVDETEIARHFKNGSDVFFQDIEKELQKENNLKMMSSFSKKRKSKLKI